MSDSPYSEGWPKRLHPSGTDYAGSENEEIQVVPLSDAERMREALEEIRKTVDADRYAPGAAIWCADVAAAALESERKGRHLGATDR